MTRRFALTRRAMLAALGAMAASQRHALAAPERPRDVGIGGTGVVPEGQGGSDRGIGGTGFIGTIQRFGSIFVNDRRIAYEPDVPVTIDGLRQSVRDLRIGHVVRVVARPDRTGLITDAIDVDSEVVGSITAIHPGAIEVLGQKVLVGGAKSRRSWRKGQHVAVSGLRRLDGAIAASLIEPREQGPSRVLGILERDEDGFWIGGLKLLQADEAYLGRRVLVTGRLGRGGFLPAGIENAPPVSAAGSVSIESYIQSRDGRLLLGSGLSVRNDAFAADLSPWADVRAVLDGRLGLDGELQVDDIRFARPGGEGGGNSGPHGPSGFGPGRVGPGPGPAGRGGFGPGGGAPGGGGPGGGPGGGGPGGGGSGPGGGGSGGTGGGGPGR